VEKRTRTAADGGGAVEFGLEQARGAGADWSADRSTAGATVCKGPIGAGHGPRERG